MIMDPNSRPKMTDFKESITLFLSFFGHSYLPPRAVKIAAH